MHILNISILNITCIPFDLLPLDVCIRNILRLTKRNSCCRKSQNDIILDNFQMTCYTICTCTLYICTFVNECFNNQS